ncbi:hypothetical protein ASF61_05780 [Duganella sp. Leaf126]|uniref:hypothetical protein n=1 Tax=Duganella sp. Leaf126 TaxID=1736266 RepID=UPI0006F859E8|nr:hypothetical protein [Duganella sp. Leaf126]KQQ40284.1 hypothetical protein ASF61_05780 [Duganella sp. Leaf126]
MKKSDLLARFAVHRGLAPGARAAHGDLLQLFRTAYPAASFDDWDTPLDAEWAESFFLRHRDDPEVDLRWLMAGLWQVN